MSELSTVQCICHSLTFLRLERLPEQVFTNFLGLLNEQRGDFLRVLTTTLSDSIPTLLWQRNDTGHRYKFEGIERQNLAQMELDNVDLIAACQFK